MTAACASEAAGGAAQPSGWRPSLAVHLGLLANVRPVIAFEGFLIGPNCFPHPLPARSTMRSLQPMPLDWVLHQRYQLASEEVRCSGCLGVLWLCCAISNFQGKLAQAALGLGAVAQVCWPAAAMRLHMFSPNQLCPPLSPSTGAGPSRLPAAHAQLQSPQARLRGADAAAPLACAVSGAEMRPAMLHSTARPGRQSVSSSWANPAAGSRRCAAVNSTAAAQPLAAGLRREEIVPSCPLPPVALSWVRGQLAQLATRTAPHSHPPPSPRQPQCTASTPCAICACRILAAALWSPVAAPVGRTSPSAGTARALPL